MPQNTLLEMLVESPTVDAEWHRRRPVVPIPEEFQNDPYDPNAVGTIYSITIQDTPEGPWVLIPSIVDGEVVDQREAERHYRVTGEHLGKFKTSQDADSYAKSLSDSIGQGIYAGPPKPR
jgi:hypothetical protein